jgi:hypothetical protein
MKVSQLRKVLETAEQIYRVAEIDSVADSLSQTSRLCEGCENMTVSNFVKLISRATTSDK